LLLKVSSKLFIISQAFDNQSFILSQDLSIIFVEVSKAFLNSEVLVNASKKFSNQLFFGLYVINLFLIKYYN